MTTPLTPDETHVVIDTGASISITNEKGDLISEIAPVQHVEFQGIASGLKIEGIGTVSYLFQADDGSLKTLQCIMFYMSLSARSSYYVHDTWQ